MLKTCAAHAGLTMDLYQKVLIMQGTPATAWAGVQQVWREYPRVKVFIIIANSVFVEDSALDLRDREGK
jgi:hypothetical protein